MENNYQYGMESKLTKDTFGQILEKQLKLIIFQNKKIDIFFTMLFLFLKKKTLIEFPFNEKLTSKEDRYWAQNIIENQGKNILYYSKNLVEHYYTKNGATWKNI